MVTKSKLKMALAAEKGTDFGKLHLKKKEKVAKKKNKVKAGGVVNGKAKKVEEEWESVDEEDASGSEDGGAPLGEDGDLSEEEEDVDVPMQVNSPLRDLEISSNNQFADRFRSSR